MLEQIKQILAQMAALGADLSSAMRGQESRMFFQIEANSSSSSSQPEMRIASSRPASRSLSGLGRR